MRNAKLRAVRGEFSYVSPVLRLDLSRTGIVLRTAKPLTVSSLRVLRRVTDAVALDLGFEPMGEGASRGHAPTVLLIHPRIRIPGANMAAVAEAEARGAAEKEMAPHEPAGGGESATGDEFHGIEADDDDLGFGM